MKTSRRSLVRIDPGVVAEQQRLADTFHGLGLIPKPIVISDAVRKSGS